MRARVEAADRLVCDANLPEDTIKALADAAREGGRGVLYAVSADGRVRQRLVLADGDVREPAWSPYRIAR